MGVLRVTVHTASPLSHAQLHPVWAWPVCRWPGLTELRDWHEFPHWEGVPLATRFPNLEPAGVDLMQQMFVYDPAKRITVSAHVS